MGGHIYLIDLEQHMNSGQKLSALSEIYFCVCVTHSIVDYIGQMIG
jgi:hypothetical protein